jgi:hypothetical protein
MKVCRQLALLTLLALRVAACPGALAQDTPEKKVYTIARAVSAIEVDARLDEPAWDSALAVTLDYETFPGDNIPAKVHTEGWLAYDDTHLFVAFQAHDPEPEKIRAHYTDRDAPFNDDMIGVMLDTFNDERRAYEFFVNPLGVQMDLVEDDVSGNEDPSWDAIWKSAGRLTDDGYIVEMAIPFNQLRFPRTEGSMTWGIDIARVYPRDQAFLFRLQPRDYDRSCHYCQVSKLTGLEGLEPGRTLAFYPTLTGVHTERREDFPEGGFSTETSELEPGITTRWGVTPNITLVGTVNPDFSQVEADVAQLDINRRFTLFFPEKRPFFLEDADYFQTPIDAIYTRTVADPIWGARITGKEGGNAFGFFAAQDEVTNLIFPGAEGSSFTSIDESHLAGVLRYRRDVGEHSNIGGLVTARQGADGYENTVYGVDGRIRFSNTDSIRLQVLGSTTAYPDQVAADFDQPEGRFSGHGAFATYDHESRNWWWGALYEDMGKDFRADSGFVPQVDFRKVRAGLHRNWWFDDEGSRWSRFGLGGDWDYATDQDGNKLEHEGEIWAGLNGPLQSRFEAGAGVRETVFRDVSFDQSFIRFSGNFSPNAELTARCSVHFGHQLDFLNVRNGDQVRIVPRLTYRIGRHLSLSLDHTYQRLGVNADGLVGHGGSPGGRLFRANLTQVRGVYQFNTRSFVRAIIQYADIERDPDLYREVVDRNSRDLFGQFLYSFKLTPQTVFFLGYSENQHAFENPYSGMDSIGLTRSDWTLFVKIGYAWLL